MKSNHKKIGEHIQLVDERNSDLEFTTLLGLTIDKEFIPSVANTVGTDMANYKIIRKNQFACSLMQVRRDKKIPVALLKDFDEAIISQAYPVFEIIDTQKLLPEYLMMWFSRSEFDREACFYAVGGVRGSLEWEDFCNMELPVPDIKKQKAIVKEYNAIVNRIKLNEQLNQKLEDTAQSIYKQWFVDFEFPNENGKPYKSSAGKMVWNEELEKEIPKGWRKGTFNNIAKIEDGDRGKNYPSIEELNKNGHCLFLSASNFTNTGFRFDDNIFITKEKDSSLRKGKLQKYDIVMTSRGSSIGKLGYYSNLIDFKHIRINSGMLIFRCTNEDYSLFLFTLLKSLQFKSLLNGFLSGSAQPQLPIRDLVKIPIIIPTEKEVVKFSMYFKKVQRDIDQRIRLNSSSMLLKNILLSRMAKGKMHGE